MYPIEKVLSCLQGFSERRGEFRARCPAHNGTSADSLSVKEGDDGRVLIICHSGCKLQEICNALGISVVDLFVHNESENGTSKKAKKSIKITKGKGSEDDPTLTTDDLPDGTYWEFTSPSGEVLYIQRHKREYYRRVGEGLWKKGLDGMAQVLYNLPELLDGVRTGKAVYHLEGPKDVETARARLGVIATTSGGTTSWRSSYREHYVGADVAIISDNDKPGRKYAAEVARDIAAVARSVKVIDLPGLMEGEDLTDWLDAGHTKQEFFAAVQKAPAYHSADENPLPAPTSLRSSSFSKSPISSPKVSPFPVEALPNAAREFVEEAAEAIGCAVDLIAAPVLAVLSSGIGASRVVEIKRSWREGAALFVAVVAEPGDKKTPAANVANRPVMRRQAVKRNEYKTKKAGYERELREWKAECQGARKDGEVEPPAPTEPTMERVYADDTTVEATFGILEENPRGLLDHQDELTGWIRSHDQYKGGRGNDRQHYLSIWSNTPIVVDRKSRQGDPILLDRPFVTLAGGIQPAMLPELGGSMEDGLLDRFLFAYPPHSSTDLSDVEMEPGTEEGFARLYDSLCSLRMVEDVATGVYLPNVTPMSPEAKRRFKEIHDAIGRESQQAGFPTRLRGVWAKMRGYLARISLILALCRCTEGGEVEQVEEEDIENAAVILTYFQSHARRVYGKLGSVTREDLLAGELQGFLEDHGTQWRGTATELYAELEGRGASGLPENAEWLSKNVRTIAATTEGLTLDPGYRGKERILKLGLINTDDTVGTVGESPSSANGTASTDSKYADGGS